MNELKLDELDVITCEKPSIEEYSNIKTENSEKENEEEPVIYCSECSFKSDDYNLLINHLMTHDDGSDEQLIEDEHEEPQIDQDVKVVMVKNNRYYQCHVCSRKYQLKKRLYCHIKRKHAGIKMLKCRFCDFKTFLLCNLKLHLHEQHEISDPNKYRCIVCGYEDENKDSLLEHLKTHENFVDVLQDGEVITHEQSIKQEDDVINETIISQDGEFVSYENIIIKDDKPVMSKDWAFSESSLMLSCNGGEEDEELKPFYKEIMPKPMRKKRQKFKCMICSYEDVDKDRCYDHIKSHEKYTKQACFFCNIDPLPDHELKLHMKEHVEEEKSIEIEEGREIICPVCDALIPSEGDLMVHMSDHKLDEGETFSCKRCSYKCKKNYSLTTHILYKHSVGKIFRCIECHFEIDDRDIFVNHMRIHWGRIPCKLCNKSLKCKESVNHHMKTMHSDQPKEKVNCVICGKILNKSCLKAHLQLHERQNQGHVYQCSECNFTTYNERNLDNHFRCKHMERLFKCKMCTKTFSKRLALLHHVKGSHSEPVTCKICNKTLKSDIYLKQHMLLHKDDSEKYKCSQCDYMSISKNRVEIHFKKHLSIYEFCCKQCDFKSKHSSSLRKHIIAKHTNDKPYICEVCNAQFSFFTNLKRHLQTHEEKKFNCPLCKFEAPSKLKIRSHLKTHYKKV